MSFTDPRLLLFCAATLALGACDNEGEQPTEVDDLVGAPPAADDDLIAVTDEGEQVVFAGPNNRGAPATRGHSSDSYDEDELIREPNTPDPEEGEFTLEEAVDGMEIDGDLIAEIGTQFGDLLCELDPHRAPVATANFIGLARGLRPWWDARAGEWVTRPYYNGLIFHRVIPEYLIQGGDYLGDGSGTIGYTIDDERDDTLSHDRAGQLCMANMDGPDSAGAQFFITDGPAPQLDAGGYTIFGECKPAHVISQIARVPQNPDEGNRPLTDVNIRRVLIRRVVGGLEVAEPTRPEIPEDMVRRGASPDPSSRGRRRFDPTEYGEPSPMPPGRTGPPLHRH